MDWIAGRGRSSSSWPGLVFIGLLLWQGFGGRAMVTIVFDLVMVALYAAYLVAPSRAAEAAPARG